MEKGNSRKSEEFLLAQKEFKEKKEFYRSALSTVGALVDGAKELNGALLDFYLKRTPENRKRLVFLLKKCSTDALALAKINRNLPEPDDSTQHPWLDKLDRPPCGELPDLQSYLEKRLGL